MVKHGFDVTAEPSSSKKGKTDFEWKQLHSQIHLLDVACNVLSSYGFSESVGNQSRIILTRDCTLRCVFTIFIMFRNFVANHIEQLGKIADVNECVGEGTRELRAEEQTMNGIFNFGMMDRPPSNQKELLKNAILNITRQAYEARSVGGRIRRWKR